MRWILALAVLGVAACGAPELTPSEHAAPAAPIAISDPWAAPTPGGVNVSAGYLTITNSTDAEDRLIAITSPRAGRAEIHEMAMEGAIMQMRPVAALPIAAGQSVTLAPGGAHIMFYDVTQPFAVGETIPVQLTFEHGGVVDATLTVRVPGAAPAPAADHGGH